MKTKILKEKREKNEYGVEYLYQLKEEYQETSDGTKFNTQYVVLCGAYIDGHFTGNYFRIYKRLANAMKDSYVELYLK